MNEINIRIAVPKDSLFMPKIHNSAIMELAKNDYDLNVLTSWADSVEGDKYEKTIERDRKSILNPDNIVMVAEVDNDVIAFCTIVISKKELKRLYIAPSFARKGIARRLLEASEEEAKKKGIDGLSVNASINAEAFYNKLGYLSLSKEIHNLRDDIYLPCVKMHKILK